MSLTTCSLHALLEVENFDQAMQVVDQHPNASKIVGGSYNSLPLTTSLLHQPPIALVEMLLNSYPESPQIKNDLGMLPLRVAIRNKASTEVIMRLIESYPDGVNSFGISGKTVSRPRPF